MIDKGIQFPQFRMLSNRKSYYKITDATHFQEIQLSAFEPFITVKNWVEWQEEYTLVKVAFPINWRSPYAT
jgi:alpha-mannosidase